MRAKFRGLARSAYVVIALALVAVSLTPMLQNKVLAYGLVTSRSIQMSTSATSAAASYTVTFTGATASQNVQAIIVDFCAGSSSPIIGTACTAPASPFAVGSSVSGVTVAGESGGTWTGSSNNSGRTFELANGSATGSMSTGSPSSFTMTGVTNTATSGTFYARIFTFTSTANATTWLGTADGSSTTNVVDAGGFALSTATAVSVTATVQETLSFCVSKSSGCTGSPNLTLGTGTPKVLDSSSVYTDTANTQISTNAQSGVVVKMASSNTSGCTNGGLKSGSSCIPGVGTFATITAGTADFGLSVADGTGSCGVTHSTSPQYGTTAGSYAMTSGVTTPPGDQIEQSSGAVNACNSTLTFAATASNTTPAGVYSGNYQLVATGTF